MLLMHRVWPHGDESSIFPLGSSPSSFLARLRADGGLGPRLEKIMDDERDLANAQRDHGRPREGAVNDDAVNHGSDSGTDDESIDGLDCEDGCASESEQQQQQPLEIPSVAPDASGALTFDPSRFKALKNHVGLLTQTHTCRLKKKNQLSQTELQRLSDEPTYIFPYENSLEMKAVLEFKVKEMSKKQRKCYHVIEKHFNPNSLQGYTGDQLRMVLSGEGGTGKTKIIHAVVLMARIAFGRTESVFGSVLVMGPTGCSAYNAGGCTWQSALNKTKDSDKNPLNRLSQTAANKLQSKLKGVKLVIFDEFSMLSQSDLVDIDRRLRAAQTDAAARKLPFGGLHVLFCGDFYQLPPVAGSALFVGNSKYAADQKGRELWTHMNVFGELIENFRWKDKHSTLAKIAPFLRMGEHIPPELLDDLNKNVALSIEDAEKNANPDALWIAPTNAECAVFNKRKTRELYEKRGALSCTIWAKHGVSKDSDISVFNELGTERRKQLLDRVPTKKEDLYHGKGIGVNCLRLCVGSRVRCTQNLCTMVGLYNGALGTVVGFGFPQGQDESPSLYSFGEEATRKNRVASLGLRYEPPLVFVQMDNAAKNGGGFEGCKGFVDTEGKARLGVVCFSAVAQEYRVDHRWVRWIHPLLPAHASTYHKAQGLTLFHGEVMQPPKLGTGAGRENAGPELGLAYVGVSRVTKTDGPSGLTLLAPLLEKHFTTRPYKRMLIKREYERLRALSGAILDGEDDSESAATPPSAPTAAANLDTDMLSGTTLSPPIFPPSKTKQF